MGTSGVKRVALRGGRRSPCSPRARPVVVGRRPPRVEEVSVDAYRGRARAYAGRVSQGALRLSAPAAMKESTLKCSVGLAPRLSVPGLNAAGFAMKRACCDDSV